MRNTWSREQENSKQPNGASGGKRHPGTAAATGAAGGMKNRIGRGKGISQKRQIPVKEFKGLNSSVETMKAEFSDISRLLKSKVAKERPCFMISLPSLKDHDPLGTAKLLKGYLYKTSEYMNNAYAGNLFLSYVEPHQSHQILWQDGLEQC